MVLLKRICPPERRKAVIAVSVSLSHPTISVNTPPQDPFQLRISLRIAQATQPGRPITIRTDSTVFRPSDYESEYDTLARGSGFGLVSATDNKRHISLGGFLFHNKYNDLTPDLKERPYTNLLTIPADGAVKVAHDFSISRIFHFEERLTKDDVVDESWKAYINDGYVGTIWWCWGDLADDLKEKHLHGWHEGYREHLPKPEVDDKWVLGCDPTELIFEYQSQDADFRFIE